MPKQKPFAISDVAAMGGHARAASLTAARRSAIAKHAVACREKKRRAARRLAAKAAKVAKVAA